MILAISIDLSLIILFSSQTYSCIMIIRLCLVPILLLVLRVISLLIQYPKVLEAMSYLFEAKQLLIERPEPLQGLGPYQHYLHIEATDHLVISYWVAVFRRLHEISHGIQEVIA